MKIEDLLGPREGNPEENKKKVSPLKSLQTDLDFYSDSIKEVATEIDVEGISSYPIFVAHQHEMKIGELILDREELGTQWTIHASTLEEFIEKGLIKKEKKELFVKNYKNASEFMCLFVVVPEGANFVYYPYKS
jgi:hypothetical protein